jgi:hypothetical protein
LISARDEGELAQARRQLRKLKLGVIVKIVGSKEGDERPGMFLVLYFTDDLQRLRGDAAGECRMVTCPSRCVDDRPKSVDARSDAVQTAEYL